MPINLLLSLTFAAGQIVVGAALAWYGLRRERWRAWRAFLAALAGVWFFASGTIEALVSGMEVSQRLTGAPGAVTFALWRGRGDTALLVVTIALAACGLVYAMLSLSGRVAPSTGKREASEAAAHEEGGVGRR